MQRSEVGIARFHSSLLAVVEGKIERDSESKSKRKGGRDNEIVRQSVRERQVDCTTKID